MPTKRNTQKWADLGRTNADTPPPHEEPPPEAVDSEQKPVAKRYTDWLPPDEPNYTAAGRELFFATEPYLLPHSEKGGGKTFAAIDKGVHHCFEHSGALMIICVRVMSQANKGGAWNKLQEEILPKWRKKKGLEHTPVMQDKQKNELIWVRARNGKWSQIVLISAPFGTILAQTLPGYEPSFVVVDELTECDSDVYFTGFAAQLKRRKSVPAEAHQFVGPCNPKGPSHWVYKIWFEDAFDPETGQWDSDYRAIRFSLKGNMQNMHAGYDTHLKKIYRNKPIEALRLIEGEWIDRPSGNALFGDLYSVADHVRPLTEDGKPHPKNRLLPSRTHSTAIGIDSGGSYHAFPFMQWLPVDGEMKWVVYDEIVLLKRKLSYKRIIPLVMRRLKFWKDLEEGFGGFIGISDESAFNQFRAGTGSFDVTQMTKEWRLYLEQWKKETGTDMGLDQITIRGAPKFNGSVAARVRLLQEALANNQILVSASCKHTQRMLLLIESKKQPKDKPHDDDLVLTVERSDHIHIFDAITYVMLMGQMYPGRLTPPQKGGSIMIEVHSSAA